MSDLIIKIAETEKELIEFEKGIYEAFSQRNPDNWLCRHYNLIDNCRYQSSIPYSSQTVYLAKEKDKVIAGASVNFDNNNVMQFEEIGFKKNNSKNPEKFAEGLLFYSLRNTLISPFKSGIELRDFMKSDLKKNEIKYILGTCSEDKKSFYVKFGYTVIEEKINYEGEKKYLLKMDI